MPRKYVICSPVKGVASDVMDTLPLTAEQSEKALEIAAAVPSPRPSPSPELTANERRANYQNTVLPPSPSPAGPPSKLDAVEAENPGVAEVVGMVTKNMCLCIYRSTPCHAYHIIFMLFFISV